MKVLNTLIICITILAVVGSISYFVWSENILENPYEQCLEFCKDNVYYNERFICLETCHEDFKEIILEISDKFFPIMEQFVKGEQDE